LIRGGIWSHPVPSLLGSFFPQSCVLCDKWVLNDDASPLCLECLEFVPRFSTGGLRDPLVPLSMSVGRFELGPPCHYCGIPLPGSLMRESNVCSSCRSQSPPFDFSRTHGPYQGSLRTLIRSFKFHGFRRLVSPLAQLLEECYLRSGLQLQPGWIIPVPLHRKRKLERGFDQTLLLGRALGRRIGLQLFKGLRRLRNTAPQVGLDIRARKSNLRGAFGLKGAERLEGQDVLLIDDVFTTGTTVGEISALLKSESQVRRILVLTLARVPLLYR